MHKIASLFKEIFLYIVLFFSLVLGYFIPLNKTINNGKKKFPIVLVHGLLNQNLLYYFFKKHLEKQGYQVYMPNIGLLTGDISKSAHKLSDFFAKKSISNAILIGASMGGVVSLYYLQELDGWNKVKKLITIGSPFKCFPMGKFIYFIKSARQISNDSFLTKLLSKKNKFKKKTICISSCYDEVVPANCAKIDGTINETINIIGHINLIAFSELIYKKVDNYI